MITAQIPRSASFRRAICTSMMIGGVAAGVLAGAARPVEGTEARQSSITNVAQGGQVAGFRASRFEAQVAAHPSRPVRTMVAKINSERARRGLRPYRYNTQLSVVALRWAHTMRATQNLKHNPRLTQQVRGYRWVGENVGYGPNVSATHRAFMKSPAHRANVLDRDYTQIGVSVVKDSHGRNWVVEVFRDPR